MTSVDILDSALKGTSIEPEQVPATRDTSPKLAAPNSQENPRSVAVMATSGIGEHASTSSRPNSVIPVHRKSLTQGLSDDSSDSDYDDLFEDLPSPPMTHSAVIGDYVNVGHQNWLALRQEWKKRPVDWTPKRRLALDSQTICDRITTSGVLSERSDEGVPLPEVVRVMVQVWEKEGVN